ncbi:MAG: hypothetical protein LH471_04945 [Salinibacterium sp.]|nr:hypothetical protein [Salinibacterium sp.]
MTLNTNFAGIAQRTARLEGSERGLDGMVGLVLVVAGTMIGALSLNELQLFAASSAPRDSFASEGIQAGLGIAVVGAGLTWLIAVLIYLLRIATGRRSWTAPLWGTIFMTVFLVAGFAVMNGVL